MQTSATQDKQAGTFLRRIGSTTYHVGVHFSKAGGESMHDKILRLIRNEAANGKGAGR